MFKRALNMFNRSPAPATEPDGDGNGGVGSTPHPSSHAAAADEKDLENPLLQKTTDGNGGVCSTPPPLSYAAAMGDENDLENPLLQMENDGPRTPTVSSPRDSGGCSATKDPQCEWLILALTLLAIFGVVVYYFVKEVNRIYDNPGFKLDSLVVSSFNVSKTFPETRWDTELSLDLVEGNFKQLELRYEAPRLWVYSGDEGFVSMTSPSMKYSPNGKKLILHAVFGVEEDIKHRVVNLDVVVESNAVHTIKIHSSQVEIKSFMVINCDNLKIEFDRLDKKFGTLIQSGKSCRVQVCPINESHPLYDGVDECTTS